MGRDSGASKIQALLWLPDRFPPTPSFPCHSRTSTNVCRVAYFNCVDRHPRCGQHFYGYDDPRAHHLELPELRTSEHSRDIPRLGSDCCKHFCQHCNRWALARPRRSYPSDTHSGVHCHPHRVSVPIAAQLGRGSFFSLSK